MDLNCDLGESYGAWTMGDDGAMLEIVTSANVACGFHAGDPAHILQTLQAAAAAGVVVGAHVSYPDLVGFGRRNMDPSSAELVADIIYQIGALQGLAAAAGTRVRYVKAHGALYNTAAHDERQGNDLVSAMLAIDSGLSLLALAGSPLIELARTRGLEVKAEVFADRAYHDDGSLVSRRQAGAVLHDAEQVAARMLEWVERGEIRSIEGSKVRVEADSICIHGDSPGAVAMAQRVRELLEQAGVVLRAFISVE